MSATTIHGLPADHFRAQLWQIPARVLHQHCGLSETDAVRAGETLVDQGVVTVDGVQDYLREHPEDVPQI